MAEKYLPCKHIMYMYVMHAYTLVMWDSPRQFIFQHENKCFTFCGIMSSLQTEIKMRIMNGMYLIRENTYLIPNHIIQLYSHIRALR